MKKYSYTSLRQFSWSGKKEKTKSEILIENTVLEWYDAKHRQTSLDEIAFINSIKITSCPYCNGAVNKIGHRKDGIQRYICKECHRKFNPLTGTIFDSHKIPISEWIEYLTHLFEFHSIKTSSTDNRNSETTGKYWLNKVFFVLEGIQENVLLEGNIFMDETFLPISNSKKKTIGGLKLSGISRNQLCIATALTKDVTFLVYLKRAKPTDKAMLRAFKKHIKDKSLLIHDGELSHNCLIDEFALKSEVHTTKETKKLKDRENPLDPINNYHDLFKKFMRSHGGYDRSNITGWLNLFWFITNGPKDKNEKIKNFINLAVKKRIILRYRDVMVNNKI